MTFTDACKLINKTGAALHGAVVRCHERDVGWIRSTDYGRYKAVRPSVVNPGGTTPYRPSMLFDTCQEAMAWLIVHGCPEAWALLGVPSVDEPPTPNVGGGKGSGVGGRATGGGV